MLREAVDSRASVLIWVKDAELTLNSSLVLLSAEDQAIFATVPKSLESSKLGEVSDAYFSISLLRANIFFRARSLGPDKLGLKFALPQQVFKVQRRRDLRFVIPDGHTMRVEFQDPLFVENRITRKVHDLSACGCSLIIDGEDRPVFQPGLVLRGLKLRIRDRCIETDAEVRHVAPFPEAMRIKGVKVGLKFTSIKVSDSDKIAAYVLEESRRHYLKFI